MLHFAQCLLHRSVFYKFQYNVAVLFTLIYFIMLHCATLCYTVQLVERVLDYIYCTVHHFVYSTLTVACSSAQLLVGVAQLRARLRCHHASSGSGKSSQVAAGPEVGQLGAVTMEEGERTNVATFYFTHQEKEEVEEEGEEVEEDEGGTASDAENGNQVERSREKRKRVLHYSTEDIHLLASQVPIGHLTTLVKVKGGSPCYCHPPTSD